MFQKMFSFFLIFGLSVSILSFHPNLSFAKDGGGNQKSEITDSIVTYDEMIDSIASSKNITKEEAKSQHPDISQQLNQPTSESIQPSSLSSPSLESTTTSSTYTNIHEIKVRQYVTSIYRPALQLFVWTYNSGSFHQYVKMEDVDMDRKDLYTSLVKQYQGKITAKIIDSGARIWWYINGDFYDKGTTTVSGTVGYDGLVWNGSGTVAYSSNYYHYWNKNGYIN